MKRETPEWMEELTVIQLGRKVRDLLKKHEVQQYEIFDTEGEFVFGLGTGNKKRACRKTTARIKVGGVWYEGRAYQSVHDEYISKFGDCLALWRACNKIDEGSRRSLRSRTKEIHSKVVDKIVKGGASTPKYLVLNPTVFPKQKYHSIVVPYGKNGRTCYTELELLYSQDIRGDFEVF